MKTYRYVNKAGRVVAVVFPMNGRYYVLTPHRFGRVREGAEEEILKSSKWQEAPPIEPIGESLKEMFDRAIQMSMADYCKALDGCRVEEDGVCSHGYPSWPRFFMIV